MPLDVIFIGSDESIVEVYPHLAPGRMSRWHAKARCALELPAGTIAESDTRIGDYLNVEER